jgi:hypothetical protein
LKKKHPNQYTKQPVRASFLSEYIGDDVKSMNNGFDNGMDDETFVETGDDMENLQFS